MSQVAVESKSGNIYKFKLAYDAVNKDSSVKDDKKSFKVGDQIIGIAYKPQGVPSNIKFAATVLVEGKYIIPLTALEFISPAPPSIPDESNILKQASGLTKSNGFKYGALVGVIGGGGYAILKSKNIALWCVVGVVVGGGIGHLVMKNKTSKPTPAPKATNTGKTPPERPKNPAFNERSATK